MRTLRRGAVGEDVRAWQSFLNIPAHGTFDQATEAATRAFQETHRLDVDGLVGKLTHGKAMELGFSDTEHPVLSVLPDEAPGTPGQFHLSSGSLTKLEGVKEPLVRVVKRAIEITTIDFTVLEGLRSIERQRMLLARGSSTTLRSRHLTGDAVDIAPLESGCISWDWPLYDRLAIFIKAAAEAVEVRIEWGGDWKSFKDGPHWQLPWSS